MSATVSVTSTSMRYWDDFHVGDVRELGSVTVSEAEILDFARQFDPQPFHIDREAAKATMYNGLIASGWHTTALFMGLFVRAVLIDSASLGSPGVDEIRWWAPVRPGDTLTGRSTIADMQPSSKDPGRGTIFTSNELRNQDDVVVMTLNARGFFARRSGGGV
jgi:acyl dehydratase